MKDSRLCSELFRLAVRLAGLFFLCIGLKDLVVQGFLLLAQGRGAAALGVVSSFLPVAFTLTVALWLLRANWLIRLAYPEPSRARLVALEPASSPAAVEGRPAGAAPLSERERTEQKLAALVGKNQGQPA